MREEKAILAGGCFWCIEGAFHGVNGILAIQSGYTGGRIANPTYEEVCAGNTGHYEAVELAFDPEQITFLQILDIFWQHIDPTDSGGQFHDRGSQYATAIFYQDARQKRWAEASKNLVQELFSVPIATQILPAQIFYPAEAYHQGYCFKKPLQYEAYRSGHDSKLHSMWEERREKLLQSNLEEKLTPLQYHVTQEEGTESPFANTYCNMKEEGLYVDITTGEPLFISSDKYDSKSGWPSFTRPIDQSKLVEIEDYKLGVRRTEVRSRKSNAHLGHVFPDGPPPSGLRYCINSASLRFIPKDKLKEEGYGDYLSQF